MKILLTLGVCLFSFSAFADAVDKSGEKCNRGFTYEWLMNESNKFLTNVEREKLAKSEQVVKFLKQKNGYYMGYIFQIAGYDPELVMAVYSRFDEHAGKNGLGDYIKKSRIVSPNIYANPVRVFYEQHVESPYSNGEYTVENHLKKTEDGGFEMTSSLIDSSSSDFSPRWSDGYFKATPHNEKSVFVVACNYMVSRTTAWQGSFNETFAERMKLSGQNLIRWINRVVKEPKRVDEYIARLRKTLN